MKIFRLAWMDYEDYSSWLFSHEYKTEEQFKEDVEILLKKYGDEYLDGEDSWASSNRWIKLVSDKLPELGYTVVEPLDWSFFGGFILNHDGRMDNQDEEWEKIVGRELMEKAKLHNRNIEDELNGYIKNRNK